MSKSKTPEPVIPKPEMIAKVGAFMVDGKGLPLGTLHGTDSLFLRQDVGTAKNGELEYELTVNVGGLLPIIRSKKSGRWWTCTWQELLAIAVACGIDDPAPPEVRS